MNEQELKEQFDLSLKYLDAHCTCDQEVGYVCPECNIFKAIKLAQEIIEKQRKEIETLAKLVDHDTKSLEDKDKAIEDASRIIGDFTLFYNTSLEDRERAKAWLESNK